MASLVLPVVIVHKKQVSDGVCGLVKKIVFEINFGIYRFMDDWDDFVFRDLIFFDYSWILG